MGCLSSPENRKSIDAQTDSEHPVRRPIRTSQKGLGYISPERFIFGKWLRFLEETKPAIVEK